MKIILRIAVGLLEGISLPFRLLPVQNKITFITRQSDQAPADFVLAAQDLGDRPDIRVRILARRLILRSPRVLLYPFHMLRQIYQLSTSKLVVIDGYCIVASVVKHKPDTVLIQIWHATSAIKKFGWQIVGKPSGSNMDIATIMHMHDKYNIVIAPSRRTGLHYQEAFRVGAEKIWYVGLPHLSLLSMDLSETVQKIRDEYSILPDKKVILYVPTFREGKYVDLKGLIDEIDFEKYELIAKIHPLDRLPNHDARVIYANQYSTTEWMHLADVIITDYSSLLVEAAIMRKPLYLYIYDIDEYRGDTGLNLDFDEPHIAPIAFREAKKLVTHLKQPYDFQLLDKIREQFIEVDTNNSRKTFLEFVLKQYDGTAHLSPDEWPSKGLS